MTESFKPIDENVELRTLARVCLESKVAAHEPRVELPTLKGQGAVVISTLYESGPPSYQIEVYNYEAEGEDSLIDPDLGFAIELAANDEARVFSHPFAKNTEVVDTARKQELIHSAVIKINEGLSLAEARLTFGITQTPAAKRHRFQRWFASFRHSG